MNAQVEEFTDAPASRHGHPSPLIIGITGAQGAGKTWSALRLATGIQRVTGGEIFGGDTEAKRMLHYADYFNFRHVPFAAPFGADRYQRFFDYCVGRGAKIIICDSMSHEHDGDGGLLDQMDDYIDAKLELPQNANKPRDNFLMAAQIKPKRDRKKLNQRIVQIGAAAVIILCYRAEAKIKPRPGKAPEDLGWQATTTSKLPYEMTVRFLLPPGSNGVPLLQPTVPGEKLVVKNPEQFRDWFKDGDQLSEDMGEKLARWAQGGDGADPVDTLVSDYARCTDAKAFENLKARRDELWKKPHPRKHLLKEASDAAAARIRESAATNRTAAVDQGGGKAEKIPEGEMSASPSGSVSDTNWVESFAERTSSVELDDVWKRCLDHFNDHVPPDIYDAYEATRARLVEREATQRF